MMVNLEDALNEIHLCDFMYLHPLLAAQQK